jgi:(2Fe-2S) ferredoxin
MNPVKPQISPYKRHLMVCTGERCDQNSEAQALFKSLWNKLKEAGIHEGALRVKYGAVNCFAVCKSGPLLCVQPDGAWYYNVTPENMNRIIDQHLVGGKVVEDLLFHQGPSCQARACDVI